MRKRKKRWKLFSTLELNFLESLLWTKALTDLGAKEMWSEITAELEEREESTSSSVH